MNYQVATFLIALVFFSGCSAIQEEEIQTTKIQLNEDLNSVCDFPPIEELTNSKTVNELSLKTALDCSQKQLDRAFNKLKGQAFEELSVRELRVLYGRNVFSFPGLDETEKWELIEILAPVLHPTGRPAFKKETLQKLIDLGRKHLPLYLSLLRDPILPSEKRIQFNDPRLRIAAEDIHDLISPHFQINFDQGKRALQIACQFWLKERSRSCSLELDYPRHLRKLESAWLLKGILLPNQGATDLLGPLQGFSLRSFLKLLIEVWNHAPLTNQWVVDRGTPSSLPKGISEEWENIATRLERYFLDNKFAVVDREKLEWAIRQLSSDNLYQLSGDLVRLSQRLAGPSFPARGFQPLGVLPILKQARSFGTNLEAIARSYPNCEHSLECFITTRQALKHPILKRLVLKGAYVSGVQKSTEITSPSMKRLDTHFRWETAVSRLAARSALEPIFAAFDTNQDGQLSLAGQTDESLREIVDLAHTFLRFATLPKVQVEKAGETIEEPVPSYINIRPSALIKILGLIGDRWMLDGNANQWLDTDEFFSIISVYQDIQVMAASAFYSTGTQNLWYPSDVPLSEYGTPLDWNRLQEAVIPRKDFVESFPFPFIFNFPYLVGPLNDLPKIQRNSFFHALLGASEKKKLEVVSGRTPREHRTVQYYVESTDPLAPVAILSLLDRLMIKCDQDEDEKLDWAELGCAMPLIMEAGLYTVESSLIDFDPGVNDGARFILRFLQKPGIPSAIARLLAINGSIHSLELSIPLSGLAQYADEKLILSWADLGNFLGASGKSKAALPVWEKEARMRFGHCDRAPQDGRIQGREEMECVVDRVILDIERTLASLTDFSPAKTSYFAWQTNETVRLALKLSTLSVPDLDALFEKLPLYSDPGRILSLIEEVIRRSRSFEEMPQ